MRYIFRNWYAFQNLIDLVNQIRFRAFGNESGYLQLRDFASKETLRSAILQERSWELFMEGYRRSGSNYKKGLIRYWYVVSSGIGKEMTDNEDGNSVAFLSYGMERIIRKSRIWNM